MLLSFSEVVEKVGRKKSNLLYGFNNNIIKVKYDEFWADRMCLISKGYYASIEILSLGILMGAPKIWCWIIFDLQIWCAWVSHATPINWLLDKHFLFQIEIIDKILVDFNYL